MTIFDILSSILFNKNKSNFNLDEEVEFTPYMVSRWLSMYSPNIAQLCNRINKYLGIFENKQDVYTLFAGIIPSMPVKKISYIKKNKDNKKEIDDEVLIKIAKSKEMSLREVKEYVELNQKFIKS